MEVRTRVRETQGDWARLVGDDAGRCDVCGAGPGAGCGSGFGVRGGRGLTVPLTPGKQQELLAGDVVFVSVADGTIVGAAARSYLLPVAGLLAGAGLAAVAGAADGMVFLAAIVGSLAGIGLGRRAGRRGFQVVSPRGGNAGA